MAVVHRPKRRIRPRDGIRQVAIVVGVGTALTAGLLAAGFAVQPQYTPDFIKALAGNSRSATTVASAASGDAAYTGSILYLPPEGSNCRELAFNNRDGRFTDRGYVDCAQASEQSGINSPKQWTAARVQVISKGFREH